MTAVVVLTHARRVQFLKLDEVLMRKLLPAAGLCRIGKTLRFAVAPLHFAAVQNAVSSRLAIS